MWMLENTLSCASLQCKALSKQLPLRFNLTLPEILKTPSEKVTTFPRDGTLKTLNVSAVDRRSVSWIAGSRHCQTEALFRWWPRCCCLWDAHAPRVPAVRHQTRHSSSCT